MSRESNKTPSIDAIRHSCSHVLAMAVLEMFPGAQLGIGPVIENGFYYDFKLPRPLVPEDLPKLEALMRRIIKRNIPFTQESITRDNARGLFTKLNQPFKLELVESIEGPLTVERTGSFVDLCAGGHVRATGEINSKAIALRSIAGAYWKGSEKNPMLQRVYGLAFASESELKSHMEREREIEKRDHRKLAHDLDLFSFSEDLGPGLVLWHPKGSIIRQIIEDYWKSEHVRAGYQYLYTPHIGQLGLWKQSGHWNYYRESMFSPMDIDGVKYLSKPMNCPLHIQIYKAYSWSYRDLPVKYCELGTVYRYEKAGVLHGLLRVRGFTQDDAHIFTRPDQMSAVLDEVLALTLRILRAFGFRKFRVELSVRDDKSSKQYLGDDAQWKRAETALIGALNKRKIAFERKEGEAVFYGPKIDVKLVDALGRSWQGPTIQVDLNLPEKFDLTYVGSGGGKERLVMIHRAIFGSLERFIGLLTEHYGGAFPMWLSPVQVHLIPVGTRHVAFSRKLARELGEAGLRVQVDDANETVGYKVRKAEKQKVPTMLVIGDKEIKSKYLHVRYRGKKEIRLLGKKRFIDSCKETIIKRK